MADELKTPQKGEIVIYQDKRRNASVEVRFEGETVWLTQAQIAQVFGTQRPAITKHLRNIFTSGELQENSVCSILEHTGPDGKTYKTQFYNLDAIISVGYRVNSARATQFRIWATNVLRDHILKGITVNQKRLADLQGKQLEDFKKTLALLEKAKQKTLTSDETAGLLDVITGYANTWLILHRYDEGTLGIPDLKKSGVVPLAYEDARQAIDELKVVLAKKGEASDLFAHERDGSFKGIITGLEQSFTGINALPRFCLLCF